MAYATVNDYEDRYGPLTASQEDMVTVKLDDAAIVLDANVDTADPSEVMLARLKIVSCAMVNRSMVAEADGAVGVSNASYTMGPFSQSATFSNPSGDLYLTASEKRMLGISRGLIGSIRPVIGGAP